MAPFAFVVYGWTHILLQECLVIDRNGNIYCVMKTVTQQEFVFKKKKGLIQIKIFIIGFLLKNWYFKNNFSLEKLIVLKMKFIEFQSKLVYVFAVH